MSGFVCKTKKGYKASTLNTKNIKHPDLKHRSIFLDEQTRLRLLSFGLFNFIVSYSI